MSYFESIEVFENWFFGYFKTLEFIDNNLLENENLRIYRGIFNPTMYLNAIDALAGLRYPDKGNKERFNLLLQNGSKYSDTYSLVSIPSLIKGQENSTRISPQDLQDLKNDCGYIENLSTTLQLKDSDFPDKKISLDDLENRYNVDDRLLNKYKYSNILYEKYRCNLVHELRLSPEHTNLFDDPRSPKEEPYYYPSTPMTMNNSHAILGRTKYNFSIPLSFIKNTAIDCLEQFCKWCQDERMNPYDLCHEETCNL